MAVTNALVSPESFLQRLAEPDQMRVPGATLHTVNTEVFAARVIADPANPRVSIDLAFPVAVAPGSSQRAVFPPLPLAEAKGPGELRVVAASPAHLEWQLDEAMRFTLAHAELLPAIEDQGVLDPVFAVATVYEFGDGEDQLALLVVKEGSTRVSKVHAIHGLRAQDLLFRLQRRAVLTQHLEAIQEIGRRPASDGPSPDDGRVRTAVIPVTIVLRVEPDPASDVDLAQAVRARVAQDHVNTKRPWRPQAQNEMLGEDVLLALRRAGVLSTDKLEQWLAGRSPLSPAPRGLAARQDERFAWLVWYFTTRDRKIWSKVRTPIALSLAQEAGRISPERTHVRNTRKVAIAAALQMRAKRGISPTGSDKLAERLAEAMPADLWKRDWKPRHPDVGDLLDAAIEEHKEGSEEWGARLELLVRGALYMVLEGQLSGERHDLGGSRRHRRKAWEVVLGMARSEHGLRQLAQGVLDGRQEQKVRRVLPAGEVETDRTGEALLVDNKWLRTQLVPDDEQVDNPRVELARRIGDLRQSKEDVLDAWNAVLAVEGEDGAAIVEAEGLDPDTVEEVLAVLIPLTEGLREAGATAKALMKRGGAA